MSRNEAVNASNEKSVADLGVISAPSDSNEIKKMDPEMDAEKKAPSQESEKLISMDESDDDSSSYLSSKILSSKSGKKVKSTKESSEEEKYDDGLDDDEVDFENEASEESSELSDESDDESSDEEKKPKQQTAKKLTQKERDIAAGTANGRRLANQGYPRPEPDDQRLYLGKSADYIKAHIIAYDQEAAKIIAAGKNLDSILGFRNGTKCAKRTNQRPDQNAKHFNGRSEAYKKAFFEGFDKQKSKSTLSDAELGAKRGAHAASSGFQRPSPTDKVFKGQSQMFVKSYLKSYDEKIKNSKVDIEAVIAKRNAQRAVQRGNPCPNASDPRFAGRSSRYVEIFLKTFKEYSDTTEIDSEAVQAAFRGRSVAFEGHKRPSENDKRFENKSAEYKQVYLASFDKTRAEMKDPELALAFTYGAHACRDGGKRPSRNDRRFIGKSESYIDSYLAGHDSTKPTVKDEAKAEAVKGRKAGLAAAKFSTKPLTAQDERFQDKSQHYTNAYLKAYAEAQQNRVSNPDITKGRAAGRKYAQNGKPRPAETDKRFDGKSDDYKKAFFAGYDAAIAKGGLSADIKKARDNGEQCARKGHVRPIRTDLRFKGKSEEHIDAYLEGYDAKAARMKAKGQSVWRRKAKVGVEGEIAKARANGGQYAGYGNARPDRTDPIFKGKSKEHIDAYLEGYDAKAARMKAKGQVGSRTKKPLPEPKEEKSNTSREKSDTEKKPESTKKADPKKTDSVKANKELKKASVEKKSSSKGSVKETAKAPVVAATTVRKIPKKVPSQKSSTSTSTTTSTSKVSKASTTFTTTTTSSTSSSINKTLEKQSTAKPSGTVDSRKRKYEQISQTEKPIAMDESVDHSVSTSLSQTVSSISEQETPAKQARKENASTGTTEALATPENESTTKQATKGDSTSAVALISMWKRSSIAGIAGTSSPLRPSEDKERDEKKMEIG